MTTSQTVNINGMHCASCANIIERTLKKIDGVKEVSVNYGTEAAFLVFDETKTSLVDLSKKIEPLGYTLSLDTSTSKQSSASQTAGAKEKKLEELSHMKRTICIITPIIVLSIGIMTWDILGELGWATSMSPVWSEFFHHLLPLMATYMLFVVGKPYMLGLYRFVRYGKANMDTLIGLGTVVAFVYSFLITALEESLRGFLAVEITYYDVTIIVIGFITLGKYLEARAKLKTGDAIEKLLNLQAKIALVVRDGMEQELPIEDVVHGDLVIVKPGSKIPVDGMVVEGSSYVDESMVTGEPMPLLKETDARVVAGTLNTNGTITLRATKVGNETLLASIIQLVEDAQSTKAPIQALADKISAVFVPIVLVIAFAALCSWLIFGVPILGFSQALSFGLTSFVAILVIACPCALGLATPTAIIVGVGKGAKEGILIKDAATLETLHKVTTIVVDKTGTITQGKPQITAVHHSSEKTQEEVIRLLASLESKSEHPLAHAITTYAKEKNLSLESVTDFEIIKGKGLRAQIGKETYYAGNQTLMTDLGLSVDQVELAKETSMGRTPILFATKTQILARVMVADAVKPEAAKAVKELQALGIRVVMLTGDDRRAASAIAQEVGIVDVVAEVLPEDKLKKVKELQGLGEIVAMAGDGVNDAPALAQADVGIAMGTGTDVAIETAGITLLHGDISKLVRAVHLSKLTMRGIKQNLFWAFFYNVVGIPIAGGLFYPFFGILLSPVFAGFAMAFSSVSVVSNSLRLKVKRL